MDKSHKHYAKQKKPISKGYTRVTPFFDILEKAKQWAQWVVVGLTTKGQEGILGGDGTVLCLNCGAGYKMV